MLRKELVAQFLRRRQRWLLTAFTLLCVLFILLPSLPGSRFALPPALRLPFVVVGLLLLPGYLLDELLHIGGPRLNLASPPLWFALSIGVLAPAGWAVLGLHTNLRVFGLLACGLIVLLCALVLLARGSLRGAEWEFSRRDALLWAGALALLLTLLGLILFWAPQGTGDYWWMRAYLRDYVDGPSLNLADPFLGQGFAVTPRLRYEIWLVVEAFLALASGLEPAFVLPELLDPFLVILMILAAYMLGKELLGSARRGLAAASLQMIGFLYSVDNYSPGQYVLVRTIEDKTVANQLLLLVAFALLLRAVLRGDKAARWGVLAAAVALAAVHGMSYPTFLLSCGLFFMALVVFRQPREQWRRLAGLALATLPLLILVALTVLWTTQLGPAPGGVGWDEIMAVKLERERIVYLGQSGVFIANPATVLFPLTVAGLLATPFLLCRRARRGAALFLLGNQIGPLVLIFMPGIPNLLSRFLDFRVVFRLSWISLPALTVAFVLAEFWPELKTRLRASLTRLRRMAGLARYALYGLAGILLVAFWLSLVLLPMTWKQANPARARAGLIETLQHTAPALYQMGDPVVLASEAESFQIASVWGPARLLMARTFIGTLDHFPSNRQDEAQERMALIRSLPEAHAESGEFFARLQKLGVELIVLEDADAPASEESLNRFPAAYPKVFEGTTHSVYLVNLDSQTPLAMIGQAQLLLARGEQDEGCAELARSQAQEPASALAAAGLGWCRDLAGQTDQALALYRQAAEALEEPQWQPNWPPALTAWLDWEPALASYLATEMRFHAQEFVRERQAALERGQTAAQSTELVWLGGWPRRASLQPGPGAWPADGAAGRLGLWLADQLTPGRAPVVDVRGSEAFAPDAYAAARALLAKEDSDALPALEAANLLKNAGFDTGTLADWKRRGASASVQMDAERRPGSEDDFIGVIRSEGGSSLVGLCQTVAVQPGERYVYFTYAAAELASNGRAPVGYWDYQRLGRIHAKSATEARAGFGWTPFWQVIRVPAGVRSISICPALLRRAGTVQVNGVWLAPLTAFKKDG